VPPLLLKGEHITSQIKAGSVVTVDVAKSSLPESALLRMGIVVEVVNPTARVHNRFYKVLVNQSSAEPKVYVFEWQFIIKVIQGGNAFDLLRDYARSIEVE